MDEWVSRLTQSQRERWELGYAAALAEGWADRISGFNDVLAVAEGCYFSEDAAQHVCEFFQRFLSLSKSRWKGQAFELIPWQRDLLETAFGWIRDDGTRRFRIVYVEIPKKNGKSGLASGLALYMLTADGENTPEVYGAAIDRDQAGIVYDEAARMVRSSPRLASLLQVRDSVKRIRYPGKDGIYRVLSADVKKHEGLDISAAIVDELHAHKNRTLWDTLRYGGAARAQPLFFVITTAGEYDPTSIGWEQHEYAMRVRDGVYEDWEYLPVIYAADENDDWTAPETWRKANPSIGYTIKEADFAAQVREALNSPTKQAQFKRYRLNIWVQTEDAYFNILEWQKCGEQFTLDDMEGRECYGGMDLSSKDDLTAFWLAFPPVDGDEFYRLMGWFWLPRAGIVEKARRQGVPYDAWAMNNYIELTEGNVIDLRWIRKRIVEVSHRVSLQELCFDPYRATEIVQALKDEDGINVIEHRTGTLSMSPCMNEMQRLILTNEIRHTNNPCMTWQISNVVAHTDTSGNVKPDRKNTKKKIDGPVAAMMGLGRAVLSRQNVISVYEKSSIFL